MVHADQLWGTDNMVSAPRAAARVAVPVMAKVVSLAERAVRCPELSIDGNLQDRHFPLQPGAVYRFADCRLKSDVSKDAAVSSGCFIRSMPRCLTVRKRRIGTYPLEGSGSSMIGIRAGCCLDDMIAILPVTLVCDNEDIRP